ncbi:3152_t:CDS:2 [Funneliformis mosseae]|uniref:3152_t:CDS:1 n=1 Tax=Funneliformis mosseae TaxID=27381 RepID=A0A9N8VN52_FUNMO|nr:3152_t:CDS:2 [Funneliformis mosseae]
MAETVLRIGVLAARDLAAADRDGFSDPYAVIRVANKKYETAVIKKTLNPVWNTSFDIKLSEANLPPLIVITVWDEDRFGRDFLGEITIPIKQVFARNNGGLNDGQPRTFDDPANQPAAYTLQKRTARNDVKGDIILKFGLVDNKNRSLEDLWYFWEHLCNSMAVGR